MTRPVPPVTATPTGEESGGRVLAAILLLGLVLRLLGIGWGLPSGLIPGEPPFHPDELSPYEEGGTLYSAPDPITFTWGGSFYFRLGWVVRSIGEGLHPANAAAATVFTVTWLRLINVLVGVASALGIFHAGRRIFGRRAALLATFLFVTLPAHVLECHYARPDVVQLGFTCAVASCAASIATRRARNVWRASIAGGLLAGLAIATMLWGVIGLVSLAAAVLVAEWEGRISIGYARRVIAIGCAIALATAVGYLLGSVETFVFWDMFLQGRERAAQMHRAGHYHVPWALMTGTAFFAFGSATTVAGYLGAVAQARPRSPAAGWAVVAPLVASLALFGMLDGTMMRYVLFLAPWLVLLAGATVDALIELAAGTGLGARARSVRLASYALVAVAALQVPLAYVAGMHFTEDARYRTGRWVARHAAGGARVGITPSFYDDWTYTPRFPEGPPSGRLEVEELQLRSNFDASGYLARGLDFIVLSDATLLTTGGDTASAFLRDLAHGDRYRPVARFGPGWEPLRIPRWFGAPQPEDLLYVRQTFTVYERADRVRE